MREIEHYFIEHREQKHCAIISHTSFENKIDELISKLDFIEFHVYYINKLDKDMIVDELKNLSFQDIVLCPYKIDCGVLLDYINVKPIAICGEVYDREASAFLVWEKCREYIDEICLFTLQNDERKLTFSWKKEEGRDIELSIIFPVYNVSKYLEKCLHSVTFWNAPYIEFIFVDDGSKDDSASIIEKWARSDSRIKLIQKENGGCASARQRGMDEAKGRYIGFVDPDDFVDVNMFKILLMRAMNGLFDISLCGYYEYYENSGKKKVAEDFICFPYTIGCYDQDKINELITFSRVAIWRGIYSKELIRKNNIHFYTDLKRFDDLPFKVETFAHAKSVIMTGECLYYYRLEREGQDVSANDERLYVHFDIFNHLNESMKKLNDQRIIDYLQMCKIQTHRYGLSKIKSELRKEYTKRASEDLLTLDEYKRTYKVANILLGKDVAEDYRKIVKSR